VLNRTRLSKKLARKNQCGLRAEGAVIASSFLLKNLDQKASKHRRANARYALINLQA
jgi:hypothetical protein